jgi:plastocyanin
METTRQADASVFHWRTLLNLVALANLAVLLFMGLTQRDTLALALGAISVAGLLLLRFRGGLFGILLLALLFADIAIWTVSGAVNNFMHREQGMALLLPSFLGVISLTGLAAAAGALLTRRARLSYNRWAAYVGSAGLLLLVVVAAASLLFGSPQTLENPGTALVLGSKNMVYTTSSLSANPGQITVNLSNDDLWWHTFSIDELDIDLHVPMGAERSITFEAPAGEYYFYCSIPGHEAIGMHGTLIVEE